MILQKYLVVSLQFIGYDTGMVHDSACGVMTSVPTSKGLTAKLSFLTVLRLLFCSHDISVYFLAFLLPIL